ncbi:MAG TPA: helix-turn-helix domain-containing protein [Bryobacteraceae bacterium]|jgi:excisionase family DNA binding protein|nr:helix-turn-helix domain-containing protein [Bryobacteraceae bacterium]
MSVVKPPARKAVARAIGAVPFPGSSQSGPASVFQPLVYHEHQWLSLPEAAAYTGLPQSALRKLLASRKLAALDTGPRLGGRWRIKRSDLDNISAI